MEKFLEYFDKLMTFLSKSAKSWTIWFNATGLALLQIMLTTPELTEWLSASGLGYLILIGNILLRFKTNNSIMDK